MITLHFISGRRFYANHDTIFMSELYAMLQNRGIDVERIRMVDNGRIIGDEVSLTKDKIYMVMYNMGKPRLHDILKDITVNDMPLNNGGLVDSVYPAIFTQGELVVKIQVRGYVDMDIEGSDKCISISDEPLCTSVKATSHMVNDCQVWDVCATYRIEKSDTYTIFLNKDKSVTFYENSYIFDDTVRYRIYAGVFPS